MNDFREKLKINCAKCSGLCCVALFCMKTDGFPEDKPGGKPCKNLNADFRCRIHAKLVSGNMAGCLAYDCFGAGQKVTQMCYPGLNWKTDPEKSEEIFQVFLIIFQLHQMEWYLLDGWTLAEDKGTKATILKLISKNEQMTGQSPDKILNLDLEEYRKKVNQILKKVSNLKESPSAPTDNKDYFGKDFKGANLNGKDFSMALLIAADLEGCSLRKTNFLGADMRDANIRNTDLSSGIFLTQMQINSAKGNSNTKLPQSLSHPVSWLEV